LAQRAKHLILDGGEEGSGIFRVAGGNAPPAFEVEEGIFHQMTQLVEIPVVFPLDFAVFPGRYHRFHALLGGLLKDRVGVITSVGQQMFGGDSLDQGRSLSAIRRGTWRNKHSDRQTKRIHGQVYFGVEPPFVRAMS
jgi:hypothetical protein